MSGESPLQDSVEYEIKGGDRSRAKPWPVSPEEPKVTLNLKDREEEKCCQWGLQGKICLLFPSFISSIFCLPLNIF